MEHIGYLLFVKGLKKCFFGCGTCKKWFVIRDAELHNLIRATVKNIYMRSIFISLRPPPWRSQSLRKIKTIGHATTNDFLIIFFQFDVNHALICPKTCGKESKKPRILENHRFTKVSTLNIFYKKQF